MFLSELAPLHLGFDGDEFYTEHWDELNGLKFGDVHLMLPDAIPLGIKDASGRITLNPRHDYIMGDRDELIVIAEDNDTYQPERPDRSKPGKAVQA